MPMKYIENIQFMRTIIIILVTNITFIHITMIIYIINKVIFKEIIVLHSVFLFFFKFCFCSLQGEL